jgi:DNA-binding MarR family transcriptional regulator
VPDESDIDDVAAVLLDGVGLLIRRIRQTPVEGGLTPPESSALARLARGGPATSSALAKLEQISPQSMGVTLAGLEERGLVERQPDEHDGRRVVLSITEAGSAARQVRRNARSQQIARALASGFSRGEVEQLAASAPLLERLALSL